MTSIAFVPNRIARLQDVVAGHVADGSAPGVVVAVEHRGDLQVAVAGRLALGGPAIGRDAIFRIYSMTKPILAVATLSLMEECHLRLDDPVDDLLPELANRRVLTDPLGPLDGETVPADRAITLRDLLTFRMGIGQLLADPDEVPLLRAFAEQDLGAGAPGSYTAPAPDEWIARLGRLPWMHQPGERWVYNTAADVLGILVSRAAGQSLATVLRERIFDPLGMVDTGFSIPLASQARATTVYWDDGAGGLTVYDDPTDGAWSAPPAFQSGAGGLVSTLDDYLAFARMLLRGGVHGTERIISPAAVDLMTRDHLTAEQRESAGPFLGGAGWGFGVGITREFANLWARPGTYGWTGGIETAWFNDPESDLISVVLTQAMRPAGGFPAIWRDVWTTAYAAIP